MNKKLLKEVLGVVVTAFCVCFFVATLADGFPSLVTHFQPSMSTS